MTTRANAGRPAPPRCPDCTENCEPKPPKLRWRHGYNTAFHGRLDWWYCRGCHQRFVTRDGENPELATR